MKAVTCMEDVKSIIIPTRFKAKISHELSFPIGAEKLSKALSDTPQFMDLVLHFSSDRWRNVRFNCYPCIAIEHSSRNADMADRFVDSAGNPLFNEWMLNIFPVPRMHRHRVQQYIIDQALPEVREWLRKRGEMQQPGEESLKFLFDEEKDEFTSELQSRLSPRRA
jgi:hypothetical protein